MICSYRIQPSGTISHGRLDICCGWMCGRVSEWDRISHLAEWFGFRRRGAGWGVGRLQLLGLGARWWRGFGYPPGRTPWMLCCCVRPMWWNLTILYCPCSSPHPPHVESAQMMPTLLWGVLWLCLWWIIELAVLSFLHLLLSLLHCVLLTWLSEWNFKD